jgi:hypothetical protein
VKQGRTELGAYMQTRPAPIGYQKLPGPTGCGFCARGELTDSGGYGSGRSLLAPLLTGTRMTCDTTCVSPVALRPGSRRVTRTEAWMLAWLRPSCCDQWPIVMTGAAGRRGGLPASAAAFATSTIETAPLSAPSAVRVSPGPARSRRRIDATREAAAARPSHARRASPLAPAWCRGTAGRVGRSAPSPSPSCRTGRV